MFLAQSWLDKNNYDVIEFNKDLCYAIDLAKIKREEIFDSLNFCHQLVNCVHFC